MKKWYIFVTCLVCLNNVNASNVCQDEILEAARSGNSVKALLCLSENVSNIRNKLEKNPSQNGYTRSANSINYDPKNPPYTFKINGKKNNKRPGDQFWGRVRTSSGLSQVTVRFLEYLKSEDAPMITYTCTDLR